MSTITPVAVPYAGDIPGGVRRGLKIEVQGTIPGSAKKGADSRFCLSLCQGPQREPITVFHLSARLDEQVIVMNHMEDSRWGTEEREEGQPFQKGKPFNLRIKVKPNIFKIKVDGRRVATFHHRLPMETARYLVIDGEVDVDFIKFTGGRKGDTREESDLQSGQFMQQQTQEESDLQSGQVRQQQDAAPDGQIFNNPQVPFAKAIPGGPAPGRIISISGVPLPKFSRFTINLQDGDRGDLAMHFDMRFRYAHHTTTALRTSCKGGKWGQEELDAPGFPFKPNTSFNIVIRVEAESYKVEVDNKPFVEFKHRMPIASGNTLKILNDVKITQVRFQ